MRSLYDNRFAGTLAQTLRRFSACACFFMFFILLESKKGEIRLILKHYKIMIILNCLQFVFQQCDFLLPNVLKVVGEIRPITEELIGRTLGQCECASLGGEVIEAHCLQEEFATLVEQLMQLGNRFVRIGGKLLDLRFEWLLVLTGGAQHHRRCLLTGCKKGLED